MSSSDQKKTMTLVWPKNAPHTQVGGSLEDLERGTPHPIKNLLSWAGVPEEDFVAFWRVSPARLRKILNKRLMKEECLFTICGLGMVVGLAVGCASVAGPPGAACGAGTLGTCLVGQQQSTYRKFRANFRNHVACLTRSKLILYTQKETLCSGPDGKPGDIHVHDIVEDVLTISTNVEGSGNHGCPFVHIEVPGTYTVVHDVGDAYLTEQRQNYVRILTDDPNQAAALLRQTQEAKKQRDLAGQAAIQGVCLGEALAAGLSKSGLPKSYTSSGDGADLRSSNSSLKQRLEGIKAAKEAGLLSEEEYQQKRREIIGL